LSSAVTLFPFLTAAFFHKLLVCGREIALLYYNVTNKTMLVGRGDPSRSWTFSLYRLNPFFKKRA